MQKRADYRFPRSTPKGARNARKPPAQQANVEVPAALPSMRKVKSVPKHDDPSEEAESDDDDEEEEKEDSVEPEEEQAAKTPKKTAQTKNELDVFPDPA